MDLVAITRNSSSNYFGYVKGKGGFKIHIKNELGYFLLAHFTLILFFTNASVTLSTYISQSFRYLERRTQKVGFFYFFAVPVKVLPKQQDCTHFNITYRLSLYFGELKDKIIYRNKS